MLARAPAVVPKAKEDKTDAPPLDELAVLSRCPCVCALVARLARDAAAADNDPDEDDRVFNEDGNPIEADEEEEDAAKAAADGCDEEEEPGSPVEDEGTEVVFVRPGVGSMIATRLRASLRFGIGRFLACSEPAEIEDVSAGTPELAAFAAFAAALERAAARFSVLAASPVR